MWYTSATQINVIVPYEIAGRASTLMQVLYKGTPSSTLESSDRGGRSRHVCQSERPGGGFQPDRHRSTDPPLRRPKSSVLQIFATGEGATTPAGVTGKVISPTDTNQWKKPIGAVTVTVGGQPAVVNYAGSAPGLVSGAFQVNVVVPDTRLPARPYRSC